MASTASQRGLFDPCRATREAIASLGACPLCGAGELEHELEEVIAGTVPADADFAEWLLNLPRRPS